MSRHVGIFYFSGTGNTQYVSRLLAQALSEKGWKAELISMAEVVRARQPVDMSKFDMIGLAHPIHSFVAPRLVHQFLRLLPVLQTKPTFILKTAGSIGGLNNGASWRLVAGLRKKGFEVVYDRLFMMPSNWAFGYPAAFNRQLCDAAVAKVNHMAEELVAGNRRSITCSLPVALLAATLGFCEDIGARFYGKDLQAGKQCTHCSRCVRECPTDNITIRKGRIRFGWKCVWCMHCVYVCPAKTIMPRLQKFTVLKGGYNLERLVSNKNLKGDFVKLESTGYYARYKEYLFDVTK